MRRMRLNLHAAQYMLLVYKFTHLLIINTSQRRALEWFQFLLNLHAIQ